jgi:hypothetical protein
VDFFADFFQMFDSLWDLFVERWDGLPTTTRVIIALTVAIGLLYVGSKSERAGWSTVLMLTSLAFFGYLFMLAYAIVH